MAVVPLVALEEHTQMFLGVQLLVTTSLLSHE
jgi:hypothetical protein